MPRIARVRTPDGRVVRVRVPDGATDAQVKSFVASKLNAKPEKGIGGKIADFARGVADSATLGYADEIGAAIDTVTGLREGGRDYDANLRNRRQTASQGGGARLAGQVAGGIALPGGKIAAAAKGVKGLLGTAAVGAGYGAAYETGSAEGGVEDRLKAAPRGAALGAAGGAAGRAIGNTAARALRGPKATPAVRTLADEGVVMTPGRRGGKIARTFEETFLGSIPYVNKVPQDAARRSYEQFNVAAYNRVLKPLNQKLPMSTAPGREAVDALNDTVYSAYDEATSKLTLAYDKPLEKAAVNIVSKGGRTVGKLAQQLHDITYDTLATIQQGGLKGAKVRDVLQDLRATASNFSTSSTANERNLGKEVWKLHDALESALLRQNKASVLTPFKKARESVSLLKRVNSAAAAAKGDGVFSPNQFSTAVGKRGYGVTTDKVARGKAQMQDLADAGSEVLPGQVPNSGSPERAAALATLGGGGAYTLIDPTLGLATGASLGRYIPGVDRALQNFSLNRPDFLVRGGNALGDAAPYLGVPGALTAIQQGQ